MRKVWSVGLACLLLATGCATGSPQTVESPRATAPTSLQAPAVAEPNPDPMAATPIATTPPPTAQTPKPTWTATRSTATAQATSTSPGPVVSSGGDPSEWVSSNKGNPTFPRCALVKWLYLPEGQSAGATTASVLADITEALQRLNYETALTFVKSNDLTLVGQPNVIVYKWADSLGEPAGQGSYTLRTSGGVTTVTGSVAANPNHWWTSDTYAGFSIVTGPNGKSTGRGWLFVHETMHVLGLAHVDSAWEIMNATLPDLTTLGPGDRNGLNTLYAPSSC